MATSYDEIYNEFLLTVKDYEMLERSQDITTRELHRIMIRAVDYIEDMVRESSLHDLSLRDDEKCEFEEDLPGALISLIVTGMNYYWFLPFFLNTEHMKDTLTTKDFSQHASHNMMFRLREVRDELSDSWRRERSWYAQRFGDLSRQKLNKG